MTDVLRIASNPLLENFTINNLMAAKGFLAAVGAEAEIVEKPGVDGPVRSIMAGETDICMVSGYNVLPFIEQGAGMRIVGGAMLPVAHAIYTNQADIRSVRDLVGRSFGIGPGRDLLDHLATGFFRKNGIDRASIRLVNRGGNADVYKGLVAGEIEAGISSISHIASHAADGLHVVAGGELWKDLPEYPFQIAYASTAAIATRREQMVRTMAAYNLLYRFLQSPASHDDYIAARQKAEKNFNRDSAEWMWRYFQDTRPYGDDLAVPDAKVLFLQEVGIALGTQSKALPIAALSDMTMAREAKALVDRIGTGG